MLLALKLLMAPVFIALVTLAGRRWGPEVSGMLTGLPLTSGPISLILAVQHGVAFAATSAAGNLVGQASGCLFCLAYALAATRVGWIKSASLALAVFIASTIVGNSLQPSFVPALAVLVAVVVLALGALPVRDLPARIASAPRWDLPARMLLAAAFVLGLTTFAGLFGPSLSGLIAPFPVFGMILAIFTHRQLGGAAAGGLLRGIVLGSWAYAGFFMVVAALLPGLGIGRTYGLAVVTALSASGLAFRSRRRGKAVQRFD
jgi:hypothetical protein